MSKYEFPGVMLTKTWKKWGNQKELWVEAKKDGFRLCAVVENKHVTFYSRAGKSEPYTTNLPHIANQILLCGFDNCMVDGEVMAENWNATSIIKRKRLSPEDQAILKETVFMYLFDYVDLSGPEQSLKDRRYVLDEYITSVDPREVPNLKLVEYTVVTNEQELQVANKLNRDKGEEGSIVKDPNSMYSHGARSLAWQKIKPVHDIDAKIIRFEAGTGKNKARLGALWLQDKSGQEFRCGLGFTDSQREEFWDNRHELLGSIVELQAQDDTNLPSPVAKVRNPVFVRLREDREGVL